MEVKQEASGTFVGGGDTDPNGEVFHEGEASNPNQESGPTIGFSKILDCDLAMEELLHHLSVKEMKILSSVSKETLNAVRKSNVFSKRVHFRICKDSIRSRVLDNCFCRWKSVKFDVSKVDDGLIDYIPDSSLISQSLNSMKSVFVSLNYPNDVKDSVRCKINDFAREIIMSSKETLEDLRIGHSDLDGIESIHFPNLKRLDLSKYSGTYDDIVEALLKNAPPLEKLLNVVVSRPSKLFAALQGRMSKLRELLIEISDSRDDSTTPPRDFDWNVVADLTKLKDLSITLKDYGCWTTSIQEVEKLLLSFPVETLTKICVHVFCPKEAFSSKEMGKHISRFSNLTELELGDLPNFDDDSLQSVIKGCSKLKKLGLVGLEQVTEFGFTGVKKTETGFHFGLNERGVSLTDLKDLTALTIGYFGIISLTTFSEVIRFEFLTSLNLFSPVRDWKTKNPREFLLQILQQNPNLKNIDLNIRCSWEVCEFDFARLHALQDEARRLFPRIEELHFSYPSTTLSAILGWPAATELQFLQIEN